MIDERFSAARFKELGLDTKAAQLLAEQLASEVQAQLHAAIGPTLADIARGLNGLGHGLRLLEARPGELTYRDDDGGVDPHFCRLRLAADTIVSTGYGHLVSHADALSESDSN